MKNFFNKFYLFIVFIIFGIIFIACENDKNNMEENQISSQIIQESNTLKEQDLTNNSHVGETIVESQAVLSNAEVLYRKCSTCHGLKGDKVAPGSVGNVLIANLGENEIIKLLEEYKARTLNKGGAAVTMYLQASNLSIEDMEALAKYISNFKK